jgi:hypothetical protein
MPTPTGGDIWVSRPLTNLSIAYFQDQQDFIADQVFPPVPVEHQYGMYYHYNKGDWLRTNSTRRAPRTESAGTGWRITRDNYRAEVQAVHVDISDQDRANQERPVIDLDRDGTNLISHDILLRRELDWVQAYFGPGLWTNTDQTGAASVATDQFIQWNRSSSTPIEDVERQRLLISRLTGKRPNVFVIGPEVYSVFKNHPEMIERIKYSERAVLTLELIAMLLDVEKCLIPMAVQATGEALGPNEDVPAFIYPKGALLAYAAPSPSLLQPSAGYTFEWTGYLGADVRGTRVKKFRMEELASDRVEVESAYDFQLVGGDLAVFFKTAVQ